MKILNTKVWWAIGKANSPRIQVLVDRIPEPDEMRYEEKEGLYYAENDGYVQFYSWAGPENGGGFYGATIPVKMKDGSERKLLGPWSSNSEAINRRGFGPCVEVDITDDPETFKRGYTFRGAAVTVERAREALKRIGVALVKTSIGGEKSEKHFYVASWHPEKEMKPKGCRFCQAIFTVHETHKEDCHIAKKRRECAPDDLHLLAAAKIFAKTPASVTPLEMEDARIASFGIRFGRKPEEILKQRKEERQS